MSKERLKPVEDQSTIERIKQHVEGYSSGNDIVRQIEWSDKHEVYIASIYDKRCDRLYKIWVWEARPNEKDYAIGSVALPC